MFCFIFFLASQLDKAAAPSRVFFSPPYLFTHFLSSSTLSNTGEMHSCWESRGEHQESAAEREGGRPGVEPHRISSQNRTSCASPWVTRFRSRFSTCTASMHPRKPW